MVRRLRDAGYGWGHVFWLFTKRRPLPTDTKKAPTPEGEGQKLPGLDSNQEPIG